MKLDKLKLVKIIKVHTVPHFCKPYFSKNNVNLFNFKIMQFNKAKITFQISGFQRQPQYEP